MVEGSDLLEGSWEKSLLKVARAYLALTKLEQLGVEEKVVILARILHR